MEIKIWILTLLMASLILTESRICQCRCCRYMGPLNANSRDACACAAIATDEGRPFLCSSSTGVLSAQVCTSKIHPYYIPDGPNLCCQLKLVK